MIYKIGGIKCLSPADTTDIGHVKHQEVVVMMGYPGSGKSTIATTIFKDYAVMHGDVYKTPAKMIKAADGPAREGRSIVFDATNSSREKRALYVNFAKSLDLSVRCVHVATGLEVSYARNKQREHPVPRIAYSVYTKHFELPDESEGFELVTIE